MQTVLINNYQPSLFFTPYRGYNTISLRDPSGVSNFNSMQVSLRHPTGYGLTYELSYTYAHTLDNIIATPGIDDNNVIATKSLEHSAYAKFSSLTQAVHASHLFRACAQAIAGWNEVEIVAGCP